MGDHNDRHRFVAVFGLKGQKDGALLDILKSRAVGSDRSWRYDPIAETLELFFSSAADRDAALSGIWGIEHIRPIRTYLAGES